MCIRTHTQHHTHTEEEVQQLNPPHTWQPPPMHPADPLYGFFQTAVVACDILYHVQVCVCVCV